MAKRKETQAPEEEILNEVQAAEANAEEQGEDGVELSVNQQIEQEVYAPVGT